MENQISEIAKTLKQDGDQTHVNAEDRVAIHNQGQSGIRFCWYHKHFGQEAKKYTFPCSWKDKKTAKNFRDVINAGYPGCKHAPFICH